jgi:hypothetical protein
MIGCCQLVARRAASGASDAGPFSHVAARAGRRAVARKPVPTPGTVGAAPGEGGRRPGAQPDRWSPVRRSRRRKGDDLAAVDGSRTGERTPMEGFAPAPPPRSLEHSGVSFTGALSFERAQRGARDGCRRHVETAYESVTTQKAVGRRTPKCPAWPMETAGRSIRRSGRVRARRPNGGRRASTRSRSSR